MFSVADGSVTCLSFPVSEVNLARYDPRGMRVVLPSVFILGCAFVFRLLGL